MQFGFQSDSEKAFPYMTLIELSTVCNLECIHCPYRIYSKEPGYKFEYMDWELYKKIADEVGKHHGYLRYSCAGEPLLYPKFVEAVRYAREKGVGILSFNTNGLVMDGERLECLVEKGDMTVIVEVSLDALTKDTYHKIRVGSDYDRVMRNIDAFLEKRRKNSSNAKIMVSIIQQPESAHEYDAFVKHWEAKVDKVIHRKYVSVKDSLDASKERFEKVKRWPCLLLWKRFNVSVDGTAHFCIDDWKKESALPYNIKEHSIEEVWHSQEYERIRKCHLEDQFACVFPCNKCREWQVVEWGQDYQKAVNELLAKKTN